MKPPSLVIPEEQRSQQIDRILKSSLFSGSQTLRNLLAFLAKKSLESPDEHLSAQDIAMEALGRRGTFDAHEDSSVRVHTARLRAKLAEYYVGEGARDDIVVQIPKGAYALAFRWRQEFPEAFPATEAPPPRGRPPLPKRLIAGGFACGAIVALLGVWAWAEWTTAAPPAAVNRFWNSFLSSGDGAILIFSNHRMAGDASTGLRSLRGSERPGTRIIDNLTGTSEVYAAYELTGLFRGLLRQPLSLHSSLAVTWEDAQIRNLILTGGTIGNLALKQMPGLREFSFTNLESEGRPHVNALINLHPRQGEQARYESPEAVPYPYDYAVVALVPGLSPSHKALILAGLGTSGTRAAVELVCRETRLEVLLSKLPAGPIPFFEALIHVNTVASVPTEPRIVTVKVRP